MISKKIHFLLMVLLGLLIVNDSKGQSTQIEFGQNRVQFHDFYWSLFESENFITYYYTGGQQIGRFTVKVAEDLLNEIEEFYDYRLNKKINILVYSDITDLGQTNIGIEKEVYNSGGTTQILDNKMFVYFDGDHQNLYNSIKEGIANIVVDAMMFGGNFVEILQNAVLLNLPEWYKTGLAGYTAKTWSVELDNELRKYFLSNSEPHFDDLALSNSKLAGHSLWYYIETNYGKEVIPEILYLSRVNRSASSGMLFTIDKNIEQLVLEWRDFFIEVYEDDLDKAKVDSIGEAVKLKIRNNSRPSMVKISPDGSKIAYSAQDDGRFKLFVLDVETGRTKKILKAGFKSDSYPSDESYPIIAWSPSGNQLITFYEKKDVLRYLTYEPEEKIKVKSYLKNFQRLYNVEYAGAKTIVFSGQRGGQTDIFTHYLPSSRTFQVTKDFYDDLDATHVNINGENGIIFSSNRHFELLKKEKPDSILPIGNLDLFYYNLDKKDPNLIRLTNTPFSDERNAQQISETEYGFLSEENGIVNIMKGHIDSVYLGKKEIKYIDGEVYTSENIMDSVEVDSIVLVDDSKFVGVNSQLTDYTFNIKEWDVALRKNKVLVISDKPKSKRQKTYAQITPLNRLNTKESESTAYKKIWEGQNKALLESLSITETGEKPFIEEKGIDTIYEGSFRYNFQSKFNNILEAKIKESTTSATTIVDGNNLIKTVSNDVQFISSKVIPYRAKFTSDFIVTQLDNSTNITGYERFGNNSNFDFGSANPTDGGNVSSSANAAGLNNLTGFINYGITDIMEDHRLVAGFKIPTDFDGTEIFVSYNNLKKRLDWRLLFYRKSDQQTYSYPDNIIVTGANLPSYSPLPAGADLPNIAPGTTFALNPFVLGLSGKLKTHYAEATLSFPIDIVRSIKTHAGYRNEKIIFQSIDTLGLAFPNYTEHWSLLKAEFIHDNTKSLAVNIRTGLRFKIFTEFHREWSNKNNIFVTGFDVRHYQKIWNTVIWANRVAYASSYGNQKVFYYLGGIEGQLNSKFDSRTPIDYTQNYGFQAGAVNLRGFAQNVRNGNSFGLWNSEIRIPIFSAFIKRPIRLAFIRDFQLVGFFDAGIAYKGIVPWDDENAFDISTIGQQPLEVEVNYYRRPTVFGMGGGIRTTVLGYYLRIDVGWGKDGSDVKPDPVWHISFSKDF